MSSIEIKIINISDNPLPDYTTAGSSGMDIRANPTGIFLEIPYGYEVQIRPRSGMAIKNGITCLNTPGTIDADYRGEIKIILINLSLEQQVINHGDRIAQMIVQKVEKAIWVETKKINVTERNEGGFGHTGSN